jgi:DNA-binding protein HU-beta
MTKAEIVKEIARKTGIERIAIEATIEALMASVVGHVSNNETISFRGFGNFSPKKRAAKIARNISKNTAIALPAHFIPAFNPSKKFKDRVKKGVK